MSLGLSGQSIQISAFLNPGPLLDGVKAAMGGLTKLAGKVTKTGAAFMAFGAVVGFVAIRQLMKAGKEAIKFQTEMAELIKVLGQDEAFPIAEQVGDLSEVMPIARSELMEVAETAARLGIRGTKNITNFTRVMAMMGVATNISAREAADALARIALQTRTPISQMENLGSVINELSNTTATTSSEIVAAMRRSAPELARFGLTSDQIAALAATLNTVSESATRAGTRLRRFAQTLTDPNKVEVFADALDMTVQEFKDFAAANPQQTIVDIVRAFEAGGVEADKMSGKLDARVRLALAALAQVADDMEENFAKASEQMREGTSLAAEYARFVGLIVSKQVMLNNKIAENRREIGEKLLPVLNVWYNILLEIAEVMNRIFDRPLEGLVSEPQVRAMEDAAKLFASAMDMVDRAEHGEGIWGKLLTSVAPGQVSKTVQDIMADFLKSAGHFSAEFGEIMMASIRDSLHKATDPDDVYLMWANIANAISGLTENIDDPKALSQIAQALEHDFLVPLRNGKLAVEDVDRVIQNWARSFDDLKGRGTFVDRVIGVTEELDDNMAALLQQAMDFNLEYGLEGPEKLMASELYRQAAEAAKTLADKTIILTDRERDRLGLMVRWKAMMDDEIVAWRNKERLADKSAEQLKKWNEYKREQIRLTKEEADALEGGSEKLLSFIEDMRIEMGQIDETELKIAKKAEQMKKVIAELPPAFAPFIASLELTFEKWAQFMQMGAEESELEKTMERLKNRMDFTTLQGRMRLLERIVDGLTDSTLEFFESIITGSGNAAEAFGNMIKSIVYEIARAALFRQILQLIGPEGQDWLGLNKMGRAKGGPVRANQLAIVGERGPELFVPNVGGNVIPNHKLGVGGGQDPIVVNNSFTIQALDGASVREVLAKEQNFIAGLSIDTISRHRSLKR
jgi:TP901 family phage tail tape measure protein